MKDYIYIGFDFSINKPAATIYWNNRYFFYFWPLNILEKKIESYKEAGVYVHSRNLVPIKKNIESSKLVLIHTIRSIDLANMIIDDLDKLIQSLGVSENYRVYISSEGLSYASRGDATLNLATYKGVLLAKIYEHFGDHLKMLLTYSPITLKSTAGCAKKNQIKTKQPMIEAFKNINKNIPFKNKLFDESLKLKTNYYEGVDDLVDSYWALQTMIKKERLAL